ncbi:hypothetical protein [Streptomyces fragilis]|uniref:Uncharacterized protein n=1 Tax=Streptomyces fragilis TaxID=67301 RepID=A0ABV2YLI8_9ACTN|nr:hypothetical protein [Streptomyces fragilis]
MKKIMWFPVLAAGAVAVRKARSRKAGDGRPGDRWLTVTVNRPPEEVGSKGELPPPLDAFATRIDVEIRTAPGDRGTELAVRAKKRPSALATSLPGRLAAQDPRQELRVALREAKSLLETGEVMRPDAPPTTHDRPGGKVIALASRRSGGEGVL